VCLTLLADETRASSISEMRLDRLNGDIRAFG